MEAMDPLPFGALPPMRPRALATSAQRLPRRLPWALRLAPLSPVDRRLAIDLAGLGSEAARLRLAYLGEARRLLLAPLIEGLANLPRAELAALAAESMPRGGSTSVRATLEARLAREPSHLQPLLRAALGLSAAAPTRADGRLLAALATVAEGWLSAARSAATVV